MNRHNALELAAKIDYCWPASNTSPRSHQVDCREAAAMLRAQHAEIDRLQRILDARPAMNAGIVEAYAAWSSWVYESEIARTLGLDS